MSLEILKSNIEQEKILFLRVRILFEDLKKINDEKQRKVINDTIESTIRQIKILNNSIPDLVSNISVIKTLQTDSIQIKKSKVEEKIISISHESNGSRQFVGINKKDKAEYLKQLQISDAALKNLRKKKEELGDFGNEFKKPNFYVIVSNRFFSNISEKFIKKGYFNGLKNSLKRGNFIILLNSYVSVILFTSFLASIIAVLLTIFFTYFSISLSEFIIYKTPNMLTRFIEILWIIFILPLVTFFILYFYPSTEKASLEGNIDYELPFVTIQMAAIAGADIEPSNIFKIIALNKEYPYIRQEAKKL